MRSHNFMTKLHSIFIFFLFFIFFKFYFIFKLYITVLVLPNIKMNPPQVSRFDARYWMLGAGALGRPRGMEWGGRREEGSGWGTHVYTQFLKWSPLTACLQHNDHFRTLPIIRVYLINKWIRD